MEAKKRERSANFNSTEIKFLVSLVEKYKNIIENKKTDAVTNKDKESAWRKIECTFNASGISSSIRTWKTLKLKYEGLKKFTKKKSSLQRQEMYRTGGGPSNAPDFNSVEETVLSICSNIKGLDARHDSDKIETPTTLDEEVIIEFDESFFDNTEKDGEPQRDLDETLIIPNKHEGYNETQKDSDKPLIQDGNEDNDPEKENKWERWHPKALKSNVSNVLKQRVTKSTVTSKLDQLSSARLELVQMQMEIARKEHQFVEEEHKLKMLHLENDEHRKQSVHELLVQKHSAGSVAYDDNNMI